MLCHSCRVHVTPAPPKAIWKVTVLVLWIGSLVVATAFSLVIGLNLVLAPAAIAIGMSIGTAARRLRSWTCPRCSAELVEPEPETTVQSAEPVRPLAPST